MSQRSVLAALSLFPLLYLSAFGLLLVAVVTGLVDPGTGTLHPFVRLVHASSAGLTLLIMIYFSSHLLRNPALTVGAKVSWLIAFWVMTIFALPLYYWMVIRRR